jgi:hypothetical protein
MKPFKNRGSSFVSELLGLGEGYFGFGVSMKGLESYAFAIPSFTVDLVYLDGSIKVWNCLIIFAQ